MEVVNFDFLNLGCLNDYFTLSLKDFQSNLYYFVLFITLLGHVLCIHNDCLTCLSLLYVHIKENYVRSEVFTINECSKIFLS
jgi:hypothetical protein